MNTPLTISAITIVFSINAQVKKLNDLSDVLVEDSSLYVGHTPIYTYDAISNVAIGQGTLSLNTKGDFNTAIGQDALFSNIEGYSNTASGYRALFSNIEGYFNTASGDSSLLKNTTGVYNTATGSMALMYNTSGAYNTATGCQALYNNLTGFNNTASGYMALMYNTTGAFNTASGNQALNSNILGNYNTATGNMALCNNTGNMNTASGNQALYNNTTGNYNTAFGYKAMASAVDATNQTVIGYEATGQADNSVVLGNENVTAVYMGEDSGAKIYAGEGSFTGNITIGGDVVVSSDARLKANIMSLGSTLAKLMLIDGKTYTTRRDGKQKIGVLAQDIQNVFPELVSQDDDKMLAVNYQGLIPILINALKEQDAKISRLEQLTKELITNE
jgi:hypothetical protein